ncbi:MAG: hypothetical protein EKK38_05965 [Hyphomicrobium sp.]|nr:MAG: hypothetical protein EKK38_05965 [Hyphomicrobium sp.]
MGKLKTFGTPLALCALCAPPAVAGDLTGSALRDLNMPAPSYLGATSDEDATDAIQDFFARWQQIARVAKASQPDWMTPLATVTPRLEQEFRSDQFFEQMGNGGHLNVYDGGKGFEFIPTTTNEVLINLPPYDQRTHVKQASGWGDWPAFTIKQRLISANKQDGDYIVTAFFGVQAPTGDIPFTNDAWVVTPTLAAGKGWGDFDIQATVGVPIPLEHENEIGTSIVTNVAFQYHLGQYFWPEFEVNYTHWADGARSGKDQVFLTPGLILGRFKVCDDSNLIIGAGYQFAVSPKTTSPVLTPTYDSNWIITTRLSF